MLNSKVDSTNLLDPVNFLPALWSPEQCEEVLNFARNLELPRWALRTRISRLRGTTSDLSCHYKASVNAALGEELYRKLLLSAPEIPGYGPSEVVLNWYEPGDYISEHVDRTHHKYNMVINLASSVDDGVMIGDTFYPDEQGRAVVFTGLGLPHTVPPVKNTRYIIIYLYENRYGKPFTG